MALDHNSSFIMARRLKELRNSKGLSHESLRKALIEKYGIDISVDSLKNYEVSTDNHKKAYKNEGMRVEYLRCLSDFYNVSSDYIIGLSEVRSSDPTIKAFMDYTGLDEKAILHLHCYVDPNRPEGFDEVIRPNECLAGLSNLIANAHLPELAREIMQFTETIGKHIEISESYKHGSSADDTSDYYKWKHAAEEDLYAKTLTHIISKNQPAAAENVFEVLVGRHLIEHQRRLIIDYFEEELCKVSRYNEYKKNSYVW